jgi:glycosyltransferase involved in cell wall biosynthesis
MSLRILIDLQGAQNTSKHRGIGRYSLALALGIARNAVDHEIFILLNGLFADSIEEIKAAFANVLAEDRFLIFMAPGPVAESDPKNAWRRRSAELLREYMIDAFAPDVTLITSMIEGADDDSVTSLGMLESNVVATAVIYDLIPLMRPADYLGTESSSRWYYGKLDSLRRANHFLAISNSARLEACTLLNINSSRITNISSAADSVFSSNRVTSDQSVSVAKRFGIVRKYLMHAGVFDKRKNFDGLIRAFAALPERIRAEYQLVYVCSIDANGRRELSSLASNAGLTPGQFVITGYVPDDVLIALYASCHLFVYPSHHEGFGLPPLEAMKCGAPAIGSRSSSVPEVIGRDDALFDPSSIESMTALIQKALTDEDFYNSLKIHARNHSAKFSWDATAVRAIRSMEDSMNDRVPGLSVPSRAQKRSLFMKALAKIAIELSPTDFEILELARCIDINDECVCPASRR